MPITGETLYGELAADIRQKLLDISPASIDRVLSGPRKQYSMRGRCTTKPGGLLRAQIPIQTAQWQTKKPGFIEADTVSHCGGNQSGVFAYTLDCVDIATGWTEQRAVLGKGAVGIVKQMRSIERALPFTLLGFDSDNGSEFVNETLMRHFLSRQRAVQFTRSRAYHKDDNAHVEQKNWTHIRQWLGSDRFEHEELVDAINDLCANEWRLYQNFYLPSSKLLSKQRKGSKTTKRYDAPKNPYQRLINSNELSDYDKQRLLFIKENTNPFTLKRALEKKLRKIFKLKKKIEAQERNNAGSVTSNYEATTT